MRQYNELPGFEELYLEDSFVLSFDVSPMRLRIEIEAVLCAGHPRYHEPRPNEQHCYLRGSIRFIDARSIAWSGLGEVMPAIDARGDMDYGGIDGFWVEDETYTLEGSFGTLVITTSALPVFEPGD